jgi:hypothetical protein
VSGTLVELLGEFGHGGLGTLGLLCGQFTDSSEQRGIDGTSIEEKHAKHLQDTEFVGGVNGSGSVRQIGMVLGFGAVIRTLPRVRCMFGFVWHDVLEALEGTLNVARHRDVASARGVVPVEGETTISRATPIKTDLISGLEGGNEMLGIGLGGIANAEVIHDKAEDYVAGLMAPKAWSEGNRFVAVRC